MKNIEIFSFKNVFVLKKINTLKKHDIMKSEKRNVGKIKTFCHDRFICFYNV